MDRTRDRRPKVAVGHVSLEVSELASAAAFFEAIGMRPVFTGRTVAVLELRGGTHLVLHPARRRPRPGRPAPFDLMVDDIGAARRDYAAKGMKPSRIRRGRIHDWFTIADPDGHAITVNSSHASGKPV